MIKRKKASWSSWAALFGTVSLAIYALVAMHSHLRDEEANHSEELKWRFNLEKAANVMTTVPTVPVLQESPSIQVEESVRHIDNKGTRRLEAGVDSHRAARLDLLMEQILVALRPYQATFLEQQLGEKTGFTCRHKGWSEKKEGVYIPGCPSNGCTAFKNLEEAQKNCLLKTDCGGVVRLADNSYELRTETRVVPSPQREDAWLREWEDCPERATAEKVWEAFQAAMLVGLKDPTLRLDASFAPPRDDESIFISIASYRDPQCRDTVRHAFERAARPEKLAVGIVQQNCLKNCMTGTGWAETRRMVPSDPDPDCLADFCASDLGKPHCDAGRVRILRLTELEALGPFFARYLNSKLWRSETFYMQVDSHTGFRNAWDTTLIEMMKKTPSYPYSVISNYPESGKASSNKIWAKYTGGEKTPEALCDCTFEKVGGTRDTVRLQHSLRDFKQDETGVTAPRYTCFVAAGFYFTHASIIDKVPFDPFLPFIFMG